MDKYKIKFFGRDLDQEGQCFRLELEMLSDDMHQVLKKATDFLDQVKVVGNFETQLEYLKPVQWADPQTGHGGQRG